MPPPKKKPAPPKLKRTPWEVIQIRSKGHMLGIVHAESKDEALRLASSDFRIKRPELTKLSDRVTAIMSASGDPEPIQRFDMAPGVSLCGI